VAYQKDGIDNITRRASRGGGSQSAATITTTWGSVSLVTGVRRQGKGATRLGARMVVKCGSAVDSTRNLVEGPRA
jgi:hypothetical protein